MSAIQPDIRTFRTWNKDVGVAIVVAIALVLGYVLSQVVINRTKTFQESDSPFQLRLSRTVDRCRIPATGPVESGGSHSRLHLQDHIDG